MQCKSANQAWAARWVKAPTGRRNGLQHRPHSRHDDGRRYALASETTFYALTYLFATNPDRYLRFWQAPIRYHSNIWDINPLLRLINAYSTALELAYLAAPWWIPMPMSSYSLSLRLLDTSGYWDADVIADEWHMFIKAYFRPRRRSQAGAHFSALSRPGRRLAKHLWQRSSNRYQQTLRHAWGSQRSRLHRRQNAGTPGNRFHPAFRLLFRVAHDILLAGAGWVILTVGLAASVSAPSAAAWASDRVKASATRSLLLLQIAFVLVSMLGIVFWYQDVIVRPPRTRRQTLSERCLTLLSFPLLPC